jgi:hypothetical protein
MGKKIFVTYKYSDSNVLKLEGQSDTTCRSYVDKLQELIQEDDHINKGENDGEDLSNFKDSTIESKLRDKIYNSTVTIVMISAGMKDYYKLESEQWIPWEVSYSLKEHSRDGKTSKSNAILALVIPDKNNSYDYFISENTCPVCHCRTLNTNYLFQILRKNMFNVKEPEFNNCNNHLSGNKVYLGNSSYIFSVKWSDFKSDISKYIDIAVTINESIESYNITKQID